MATPKLIKETDQYGVYKRSVSITVNQNQLNSICELLNWIEGYEAGSKIKVPGKYTLTSIYESL